MGECERILKLNVPADTVWEWMSDVRNLMQVNMFHESVEATEPVTSAGAVVVVPHNFFGVYQQRRQWHIKDYRKYFVSAGEHKCPDEPGKDPFPHSQSFRIVPVDDSSCIIVNQLRGKYIFPGADLVGERLFRRYMPVILDDDNQVIGVAVGALDAAHIAKPPGLLLWPLMALGARLVKKSTRRQVIGAARSRSAQEKGAAGPAATRQPDAAPAPARRQPADAAAVPTDT
jgi:hypothetical protein